MPVVGPRTIEVMADLGCAVLALQAEKSLLLEREILIEKANDAKIVVIGAV